MDHIAPNSRNPLPRQFRRRQLRRCARHGEREFSVHTLLLRALHVSSASLNRCAVVRRTTGADSTWKIHNKASERMGVLYILGQWQEVGLVVYSTSANLLQESRIAHRSMKTFDNPSLEALYDRRSDDTR